MGEFVPMTLNETHKKIKNPGINIKKLTDDISIFFPHH